MKVGLDLEKLRNRNSGLGQFAHNLATELANSAQADYTFYVPESENGTYGHAVNYLNWQRYHQLVGIPLDCDVWHSIHQEAKYFPRKYRKLLLTIHDLNFLHKYTGYKRYRALHRLKQLVAKADALSFISEYTLEQCKQHVDLGTKPHKVIYNGLTINEAAGTTKPAGVVDKPFLFSLGIITAKKNFHVLVDAMQHLPDLVLYIAGNAQSDYAKQLINTIAQRKLENRVVVLGEITEAEKNWLYQHCEAFVFPSLAEGFGLPVLEALYYGKPTITSKLTALPEIGGGHTTLLDNFEAKHIAENVLKAIKIHQREQVNASIEYASTFNWKSAANAYNSFYQELLAYK